MEQVISSCKSAADYPGNLIKSNTYEFVATSYSDRLDECEHDLFGNENSAALYFWDFGDGGKERLYVTRAMLVLSFTYQQVMPGFLDFLFTFGKQANERDLHIGGFRYQTRLSDTKTGLSVPELGWSGCDYRLCYNLKSIERAQGGGEPWSIRQAAVHHSFDVESGQASWIVVKANKLLQSRIKSATGSRGLPELNSYTDLNKAFSSTVAIHLIFCGWAGENWRWYINFLEDSLQDTTRRTLSPIVRTPTSPLSEVNRSLPRLDTNSYDRFILPQTTEPKQLTPPPQPTKDILLGFHYLADGMKEPQSPYDSGHPQRPHSRQGFSFADLQRAQNIEEKAKAAILVLKNNISVFTDLMNYYKTIVTYQGWPSRLATQCHEDMLRFEQDLSSIKNDMLLQLSRVETLLQLSADRKSLLYGILDTQNTEATKVATENMQRMTAEMHEIALKTKQETISMRIITFVTLCFLPGTFISVGWTLMSTDIVHFPNTDAGPFESLFSRGALELYLLISLPLVVITLAGWYVFYLWEIRQRDSSPREPRRGRLYRAWVAIRKCFRRPRLSILPK
ncbi:MAG: hypothetical protein Q9195_004009 [Heterodermia aff. obscurata]